MTLLFRRYEPREFLVQSLWRLSSLSTLGDQLVKDIQTCKTTVTRQLLDQVMDSNALVANANHKLNMKQRELIEPDLNPTFLGDSSHVTT